MSAPHNHLFPILNADAEKDKILANEFLLSDIKDNTRRTYRNGLILFFDFLQKNNKTASNATSIDIVLYKEWITKKSGLSPSTQFVYFQAVKRYYKHMTIHGAKDITAGIKGVTFEIAIGRLPLSMNEIKGLVDNVKKNDKVMDGINGKRNYALLMTYIMTGMRTMSICELKWSDIVRKAVATKNDDEIVEYRDFIRYKKKGRGTRMGYAPIHGRNLKALIDLKEEYMKFYEHVDEDWYIFSGVAMQGKFNGVPNKPLANGSMRNLITKLMKDAGVYQSGVKSPHSLRHSFGMYLLRETGDKELVKDLLGHCDSRYTDIYTRLQNESNASDAIIETKVFDRVFN